MQRTGNKHPVVFCEEFDSKSSVVPKTQISVANESKKNLTVAMGLCCNCGNNKTCNFIQVPGGIWHCEEYV